PTTATLPQPPPPHSPIQKKTRGCKGTTAVPPKHRSTEVYELTYQNLQLTSLFVAGLAADKAKPCHNAVKKNPRRARRIRFLPCRKATYGAFLG
ncbi:hypothetical protein COCCADRAFT_82403, partial [Bipolaris zeicola 26-R-13]